MSSGVSDLDKPQEYESSVIVSSSYGPTAPLPYELLHQAFEERAVRKPDLVAVEYEDKSITYGEMNHQATVLASRLVSLGVGVGSRVAVLMERCLEFPIGLLAVLKAGGSMMPLDASFPVNRLSFMLSDASASVVVTTEEYRGQVESLELAIPVVYFSSSELALESVVPSILNEATRHDEAYVVYTSGSTGRPKGVPVLHQSAVNSTANSGRTMFSEGAKVAQFLAIAFDTCQLEIWCSLSYGARLFLRGVSASDTLRSVECLVCTSTALSLLDHPTSYRNLKHVAVGGEHLPASLKDLWSQHVVLTNCYGPSECAIQTHECKMDPDAPVTIGHPMQNVNSYILDENMRPVPVGVVGEIYLGGICVSPGYINLPDQTAERFVGDPFVSGGGRMFRTGDYGRLLPNGHFEVHGRKDSQVKLKGYRIELEEIGEAMMRHPQVTAAAAIVKDHTHLVGFFTPANVDVDELRELVASHLPVYMVPAVWMGLESMPQNVSGKTDRLALEAMDVVVQVESLETETEVQLATVLEVDIREIGRNTSFYSLGGDSLSVIKVVAACRQIGLTTTVSQMLKEPTLSRAALQCGLDTVFEWPAVQLSDQVLRDVTQEYEVPLGLDDYVVYPVTPLQGGMLYSTMTSRSAYVLQQTIELDTDMTFDMVVDGYRRLAQTHEILRTTFVSLESGLFQIIRSDVAGLPVKDVFVRRLEDYLEADLARGFELGDWYFARLSLVTDELGAYAVLTIHHTLYDGWSLPLLMSDLVDALHGKSISPRPSFRALVDYIQAQDEEKTRAFWSTTLSGAMPSLIAPGNSKMEFLDESNRALSFELPAIELVQCAKEAGVTMATLTKFAWAVTLRKFLRQRDVIMGQVVSNRNIPVKGIERMLGATLSTVPCRVQIEDSTSLVSILQTLQADQNSMLAHSHASLVDVKKWSGVAGDKLFDTLFVFQQMDSAPTRRAVRQHTDVLNASTHYAFELELCVVDSSVFASASIDISVLSSTHARLILEEFKFTLSQVCAVMASDGTPAALWNLSPVQDEMIRSSCFGPVASVPYELVHHAFEERAVRKPDLVAVEYEDKSITYGEMNHQATVLASRLVSLGVGVGSRVAVLMERCLEFPIGLLAVLKAGGSMMPLDASFPVNRLSFMLSDASASVVVTTEEYRGQVESLELAIPVVYFSSSELALESVVPSILNEATRHDEAYVVYTSGSTGRPKGVPVLHQSVVNTIVFSQRQAFAEEKKIGQIFSVGFDGCQHDMWCSLSYGATLFLRTENLLDTVARVDSILITPTALSSLGSPSNYAGLKFVSVGGEQITSTLKDHWASHVKFMNKYGPTECAIVTHEVQLDEGAQITIGKPLQNINSYILDENMRPVPVGVVGEIYLGGICVSPGYINLPDQTAERFVDDPFVSGGGRMFRTGDYGRLLPNGHFEVHGRKDSQVKLKGYRIELEEIGEAMMRHPQVTAAAAIVKDHTHLVGFFTPANVDVDELRELVASHLPVYMVPAVWMGLESMPQNVSGKTDRLALQATTLVLEHEELNTDDEKRMAAIWAYVLGVNIGDIAPSSSFLALGGNSISLVRLVAAAKQGGFALTAKLVVKNSTLEGMLRALKPSTS
ncbi:hypothetical protein AC1031_014657 [Aphanomyces cochlioides]|nr:hypothetical protein AC1031_014657 [Aphanomyces cochlioides]